MSLIKIMYKQDNSSGLICGIIYINETCKFKEIYFKNSYDFFNRLKDYLNITSNNVNKKKYLLFNNDNPTVVLEKITKFLNNSNVYSYEINN